MEATELKEAIAKMGIGDRCKNALGRVFHKEDKKLLDENGEKFDFTTDDFMTEDWEVVREKEWLMDARNSFMNDHPKVYGKTEFIWYELGFNAAKNLFQNV